MKQVECDPKLSRKNPSERYKNLLEEYIKMHSSAKGMFDGKSLSKFVYIIDNFLKSNNCKTLLDYGAGKGTLYTKDYTNLVPQLKKPLGEYWNLDTIDRYEPALPEFNVLPEKHYDAVICTDVLEHIPESDIGWVVDELFYRADKMIFLNIACYPARKTFEDGSNVHISLFHPNAWLDFFSDKIKDYKNLSVYIFFDIMNEDKKTVTLEGFKIDNKPRVIQLRQQEDK
jgi:hypothetical protein|tara:strand:- start:89 stop:772 length:684 start_codon:yes stop_codon:yes gene_type:complete